MALDDPGSVDRVRGELGNSDVAAVHKRAMGGDADHPSPRPLADQRAEAGLLEPGRENITVGGRILAHQAHEVSEKHFIRIGPEVGVRSRIAGAEKLSAQALDEHLGNVASAVAAHVHHQALFAQLGVVPLDELADPLGTHVRHVKIPDTPVRRVRYGAAVALHPVEVSQVGLVCDRPERDLPCAFRLGPVIQEKFDGARSLVPEHPEGVVAGRQVFPVDRQDVVAFTGIHSDLRQRGPVFRFLVVAPENPRDSVSTAFRVKLEVGTHERDSRAGRHRVVPTRDIGVSDIEFGDHLPDHIIQVRAVPDMRKPRPVLFPDRLPVVAVHVGNVEEVAIAPPDFLEDRSPFLRRHKIDLNAGHRERLRVLGIRLRVEDPEGSPPPHEQFLSVLRQSVAACLCDSLELALLQVEDLDLGLAIGIPSVVERLAPYEKE